MFTLISSVHFLTVTIFVASLVLPSTTGVDERYRTCTSALFSCGNNVSSVGYPFWGDGRPKYCGLPALQLQCIHSETGEWPTLTIGSKDEPPYNVASLKHFESNITLELQGFQNIPCTSYNKNISDIFKVSPSVENIKLVYNCPSDIDAHNFDSVPCNQGDTKYQAYYVSNMSALKDYASYCSSIEVPVFRNELDLYNKGEVQSLTEVLSQGFEVNYEYSPECLRCKNSGGICGSTYFSDFVCFCKNEAYDLVCRTASNLSRRLIIFVGSACLALGISMLLLVKLCRLRKRSPTRKFAVFWKSEAAKCRNVDTFLQIYGSFALTRYTYTNIKKMTDGFKDKLGEGGYATVYKGKLLSGRLVAVKVLKLSKGDGEDFLNEVASISRTNHVNIVTVLGFCYEGNKRALIYEFLSNGSLEKFTFHGTRDRIQSLPWETLFNIAIGIASGLDYLHRGCNARILHFDIKPHNILLDEEFCPKISDFGLARLCPLQESTISMLEARGTIGYIAPEVFCRTVGGVSHKSDVYSFGMMVLDMVCGRKNLSADLQRSSEVYFPQWIYNRLELEEEASFQGTITDDEKAGQRKMILVSLWCIQTYPSNRPSMSRVVEMLQGCVESIQMPPKPNLSSPPRLALDTLITLTYSSDGAR
ncbi:hypothetical protein RND81_11G132300 [Saponaria officinalis]|uniref:non-specific serine/threonine protein kinase n=1 Tax=Saponaria officinalis TaxID=3572 RepID=A0AAW1HLL0_SAPOF